MRAASLHEPPAIGDPRRQDTTDEHREEIAGMPEGVPTSEVSEHETSAKSHALIQRSAPGDDLQPSGQLRDWEEGPREQEERDDAEAVEHHERLVVSRVALNAITGAAKAAPVKTAAGKASTAHPEGTV